MNALLTPQRLFEATNTVALLAWIVLVAFPSRRFVSHVLCAIIVPGLLAACYAAVIGWKFMAGGPPPGDVMTIAGLRSVFADDWVFAAAWTHYLVFDMVVGAWIARDAVRLGIPWPLRTLAIVLTFLAGPVGFLIHLAARATLSQAPEQKSPSPGSGAAKVSSRGPRRPNAPRAFADPLTSPSESSEAGS